MHDIFIIKELLQHILSFIPRKLIMPCALTCKSFHDAIKIDRDQDTVAKNSDMFSLLKIPYSPKAIIKLASKYKNNDIIEYLLDKNINLLDDYDMPKIIGYIGSEYLLEKLGKNYLSFAIIGLCEGLHFDLFEKYKHNLQYRQVYDIIEAAYKTDCFDMINNVFCLVNKYCAYAEAVNNRKINGLCTKKNENGVLSYIKNLILTIDINSNIISSICNGLIESEHYDTFVWFLNEEIVKNNEKYNCKSNELMEGLIINNNFKMFCYVISNNCFIWWSEDKNCNIVVEYDFGYGQLEGDIDFCELVICCIDYRRIEILTFLINYIRFNLTRYQEFLNKSQSLKFDDIANVLISNSHLFFDYKE